MGLKWQKILDIYDRYESRIICGSSENDAKIQYEKMIEEIHSMGIEECMEYVNAQYQKRMEQWNQENQ